MRPLILLIVSILCVGCGNADMGAQAYNRQAKAAANATAQSNSAAALAALQQQTCNKVSVYDGGDPLFGQIFNGASLCYATASPALAQVKVNAYISGARFCVVPVSLAGPEAESCFTMTGYTTSVALNQPDYVSLAVVSEANVALYKSYLQAQTNISPALAVANLAH